MADLNASTPSETCYLCENQDNETVQSIETLLCRFAMITYTLDDVYVRTRFRVEELVNDSANMELIESLNFKDHASHVLSEHSIGNHKFKPTYLSRFSSLNQIPNWNTIMDEDVNANDNDDDDDNQERRE